MSQHHELEVIERQLLPWLAGEGMVREPDGLLERVTTGTRGVRQRPGWLVRLLGNGMTGAGARPDARWRDHRMATALGFGSIVLVAALGMGTLGPGLLTGSDPAAVSDAASPAAVPEEMVEVTGTFTREDVQSYGSTTQENGIFHTRGPWWNITLEASDPRLSGTGTYTSNWNEVESSGLAYGASTYVLVNADGRWVGTGHDFGGSTWAAADLVLEGEGAYEGLTAYVQLPRTGGQQTFNAIITNGEAIEVPEAVEVPVR